MIKVLFEGSIFLHQNIGGISKYITKLNDNLQNQFIESKIFCPITINEYLKKKKNHIFFFKLKKIPKFFRKILFTVNNFLTIIFMIYYKPDILHFSYYNNSLLKFIKIPYILTVYDLIHEKNNYQSNEFSKKNLVKRAAHIICISKKTREDLLNFYQIDKKKISVIYLGLDKYKKIKKKNVDKKKYILFVGSRNRYKNFNNFIEAYSKSKFLRSNYKVICFGGGSFSNQEINFFKNLKIKDKIILKNGYDTELKKIYQKVSLFVTVSKQEGFGLTPFEAISFECPVVCSNIKVFKENLKGCVQFVNPDHIESIKNGMEKILKDKTLRSKFRKYGLKVIKNFKWDIAASKTLKTYKSVIS